MFTGRHSVRNDLLDSTAAMARVPSRADGAVYPLQPAATLL